MKNTLAIGVAFVVMLFGMPYLWGNTMAVSAMRQKSDNYRLLRHKTGEEVVLSVEEYLLGCLFAQIPAEYHIEALKAQAVAAHTYAERYLQNNRFSSSGDQLTDDGTIFQPYFSPDEAREYYGSDYDEYYPKLKEAAEYGAAHILTYGDEPIYAVYHLASAGFTNTAEGVWGKDFPYLQSVNSTWDKNYDYYLCQNEQSTINMQRLLIDFDRTMKLPADFALWFDEQKVNGAGYVISVKIGDNLFSGGDVWRIFNLRSPAFTVDYNGVAFSFSTLGFGHGVGLSQYGADYMARRGYDVEDILLYYYTDVTLV